MKFDAIAKDLAAAAASVRRIVDDKSAKRIAILGTTMIEASNGKISMMATDLDRAIRVDIVANVEDVGAETLSADHLAKLLAGFPPDAPVTIEAINGVATIKRGRSRYKFQTLPSSDFPLPPTTGETACTFKTDAVTGRRVLVDPLLCVSTEKTRRYLAGIFVHDNDGKLAAVATDGHRLAKIVTDVAAPRLPKNDGRYGVIIPGESCEAIARLFTKDAEIEIRIDERVVEVLVGATQFSCKLIDGIYPDTQRVIPAASDRVVEFNRLEMLAALARIAAVGDGKPIVRLSWSTSEIALELSDVASDTVTATAQHDGWTACSLRLLSEILENANGDRIKLDSAGPEQPMRISIPDDEMRLFILMPHRWKS